MSAIDGITDSTPQYKIVQLHKLNKTVTFTVKYKTGPSQGQTIGTFTVHTLFTKMGNIVTMIMAPFYIGPSIPVGVDGLLESLPLDQDITISADGQLPWDYVPKYQTLLTLFITDIMYYSTDAIPDASNTNRGMFSIPASDDGLVTSIALFNNNNDVTPYIKQSGSSYFSCPYGISSTWYIG